MLRRFRKIFRKINSKKTLIQNNFEIASIDDQYLMQGQANTLLSSSRNSMLKALTFSISTVLQPLTSPIFVSRKPPPPLFAFRGDILASSTYFILPDRKKKRIFLRELKAAEYPDENATPKGHSKRVWSIF